MGDMGDSDEEKAFANSGVVRQFAYEDKTQRMLMEAVERLLPYAKIVEGYESAPTASKNSKSKLRKLAQDLAFVEKAKKRQRGW